jgi:hypothetical protein
VITALGRKSVLSREIEDSLSNYYIEMDARYFGLPAADLRSLAYRLAIRNGLTHPFSNDKAAAGIKWLKGFFKRHPRLSVRLQQGLSAARVRI